MRSLALLAAVLLVAAALVLPGNTMITIAECNMTLIDDNTTRDLTTYYTYAFDETLIHAHNITISAIVSVHSFPSDILIMIGDDKPPGDIGGYGIKARLYTAEGGVLRLDLITSDGADTYTFDYYLIANKTYIINMYMYTEYSSGTGLASNYTIWWIDVNGTRLTGPWTKTKAAFTGASPVGLAVGGASADITVYGVRLAVDGYCPITGAPATVTTTVTTTNTVTETATVTEAATTTVTETISLAATETTVPATIDYGRLAAIGAGLAFVLLLIIAAMVRR